MKYNDWLDEWLKNYIKPSAKEKTYRRYSQIANHHIKNSIGKYELDEISPTMIQKLVTDLLSAGNKLSGEGLAANSVRSVINVIQASLRQAYEVGYAKEYTADRVKRPKQTEREVNCFTLTEQKIIEEAALKRKKKKYIGIVVCLYTGLRIGELLALEWSDVDFVKHEIFVNKSCHDSTDSKGIFCRVTEKPKTKSSKRIIPFPRQLTPHLKKMRAASESPYVVSDSEGKPVSVRSYQKSFSDLLKREGIAHKGFHSLRHTFATRALQCGMDVKTLSEILGHKNTEITLNRYVHSYMEHKRSMMNKLGKML